MMRALLLLFWLVALPASAIGPGEVMEDPALQARAMALYDALRCVRCRSETIASSNADWAQDARAVVRERLKAGDSDAAVMAFFQARYGDYVLMNPPLSLGNVGLWLLGPLLFALGGGIAWTFLKGRGSRPVAEPATPLTAAEKARLRALTTPETPGPG